MNGHSLIESYRNLCQSYYYISINTDMLFSGNSANEKDTCRSFIKQHFDRGSKQEALCIPWDAEYSVCGKHVHTVSLYLLGLTFEQAYNDVLKNTLEKLIPSINEWYDYKYSWFLTCLFHDEASSIEHSQIRPHPSDYEKHLPYHLGDLDIQHTPFSHIPLKQGITLARFSERLIENYFWYRAENESFEHGIIGGYFLFDRLIKNFSRETAGYDWKQSTDYSKNGLHWRLAHLDHFAYICDAITCHNMWTVEGKEKDDVLIYKSYGLSPLIVNSAKDKIIFKQYPLQFVLCLLDSIEPVKRFEDIPAREVLQLVSILPGKPVADANRYTVNISWSDTLETQRGYDKWIENIINVKTWMNVTIDGNVDNRELAINFLCTNP